RSQIALYRLQHNDNYPNFAKFDWKQLTFKTNHAGQITGNDRAGAQLYGPYFVTTPGNPLTKPSQLLVVSSLPATFQAEGHYVLALSRLMQEAGLPAILVGDSASNVILGHDTTLPISLDFLIDITTAVRRGAPLAFLIGDMPFGSYQASGEQALLNTFRMIKS